LGFACFQRCRPIPCPCNATSSGSGPSPRNSLWVSASFSFKSSIRPKRRGSRNAPCHPLSVSKMTDHGASNGVGTGLMCRETIMRPDMPQMHEPHRAVVEMRQYVFGPPLQFLTCRAFDLAGRSAPAALRADPLRRCRSLLIRAPSSFRRQAAATVSTSGVRALRPIGRVRANTYSPRPVRFATLLPGPSRRKAAPHRHGKGLRSLIWLAVPLLAPGAGSWRCCRRSAVLELFVPFPAQYLIAGSRWPSAPWLSAALSPSLLALGMAAFPTCRRFGPMSRSAPSGRCDGPGLKLGQRQSNHMHADAVCRQLPADSRRRHSHPDELRGSSNPLWLRRGALSASVAHPDTATIPSAWPCWRGGSCCRQHPPALRPCLSHCRVPLLP